MVPQQYTVRHACELYINYLITLALIARNYFAIEHRKYITIEQGRSTILNNPHFQIRKE